MRAIVQDEYGGPEVLRLDEVEPPVPGPGEVLVDVRAAGVERGAEHLMTGVPLLLRLQYGLRRPKARVRGREASGVVAAVGPGVTTFSVGDEVLGVVEGAFAEQAVADASKLVRKPADLPWVEAAALPISGVTAWQGLVEVGRLQPGQQVLVTGASGGVGAFAVQIAVALGATVTASCSGPRVELVRDLGAQHVVDRTVDDPYAGDRRYDLILDVAGNPSLRRLRRSLRRGGTAVLVGGESAGGRLLAGFDRQVRAVLLSPFVRERLAMFVAGEDAERLGEVVALVEQGKVRAVVGATYPLADTARALRDLASGGVGGKLVVTI